MKINEVAKLYKNLFEEGTAKGSFFITDNGLMRPQTRNVTLWGLASSLSIPERFRTNPNVVTTLKSKLPTSPETPLPAFFKFQKSPTSIFTEAVAMEIATNFNTKTCFNYPANIDKSPSSLYQSVCPYIDTSTEHGNMIFSFLGIGEELITFYNLGKAQEMSHDVMTITELVPSFVSSYLPDLTSTQKADTILRIQQDYAYQYLLRDYLGDIDFTSKNSGIILNRELGYAQIAPNFDFGEVMNSLVSNKFTPPVLDRVENYPEYLRHIMTPEKINSANETKLARYNASVSHYAQQETFGMNSEINIAFICRNFPEVAELFKQDLQEFTLSGKLPKIIGQYVGEDNIVTEEQGKMCLEYLQERSEIFDKKLEENLLLSPNASRYYQPQYEQNPEPQEEVIVQDNLYQTPTQSLQGQSLTDKVEAQDYPDALQEYADVNESPKQNLTTNSHILQQNEMQDTDIGQ